MNATFIEYFMGTGEIWMSGCVPLDTMEHIQPTRGDTKIFWLGYGVPVPDGSKQIFDTEAQQLRDRN